MQSACDQAKYAAAYLGGKQPPSHPDTEQTFAELKQRIEKCLASSRTCQAKDLAGGEDRKVAPPWLGGKWLRGDDYLGHVAVPNFFFHADHGVRDPPPQRRRARQDGLHRLDSREGRVTAI